MSTQLLKAKGSFQSGAAEDIPFSVTIASLEGSVSLTELHSHYRDLTILVLPSLAAKSRA